jgi:hypothetical protein
MKAPTMEELEVFIQDSMAELRRESGGDFDEFAAAFFRAGFKCGVNAMLIREALNEMPTDRREN